MFIIVVGVNHKTAPVEIREKFAFSTRELTDAYSQLRAKPAIEGCAVLSTCNRSEIYVATTDVDLGTKGIFEFLSENCGMALNENKEHLYRYVLYDAVKHLFRVAAGLDSMILGETQILGQVREAYEHACEHGATNNVLNTLFQQAISVGKKVRTETKIDQNAVSVSYAAVELARSFYGDLAGRSVLVMGAGKMSQLAVKYLVANGVDTVFVTNRSYQRAVTLAEELGGRAVKLEALQDYLVTADILISCTAAPVYVFHKADVEDSLAKREKPLLLIDIAVPRDIDPEVGTLPNAKLYDIDDLNSVIDHNLAERQQAAQIAEGMIEEEIDQFFKWLGSLFVVPTIVALREKAQAIKEQELDRAFRRLPGLSEKEKKVIGSLANSIVNQLLHSPIVNLKEYANTRQGHLYTETLQNLFDLDVPDEQNRLTRQQLKPTSNGKWDGGN
ncbi:MAG: glutamyl-tRNA reductase [Clostridia bacterium]|nr:glutamyl-tRNA reductase [Clostridia bacterium]